MERRKTTMIIRLGFSRVDFKKRLVLRTKRTSHTASGIPSIL